jgi:hypothetical protein
MARRHRRHSFRVVDQNNSHYEKVADIKWELIKPKQIEDKPKEDTPSVRLKDAAPVQGDLFPNYFFLVVFFVFILEGVFSFTSSQGRPLLSHCFKNSISSLESSNIAFTPIYRFGLYPCLFSRFLAASDDTTASGLQRRKAISPIVNNSIYSSIYRKYKSDQVKYGKMSDIWTIILYTRIVNTQNIMNFSNFSFQNLDKCFGEV